jgi:glycerol-3-phosphate acyltransferase PlsX
VVCDAGANIAAKPHHLHQYAIMASIYSRDVIGVESPRVGLLSIGEEDGKGTSTIKQARQYLSEDPAINFIGNVEGRDLFRGKCDVVTCDGFAGNLVLKLTEGLAEGLFKTIAFEIQQEAPQLISAFEPVVKKIWMGHDYSEYGGAPLLGLNGVCIICHGRSEARAIRNAVRVAAEYVTNDLNNMFAARLSPNGEARS